MDSLETLLAHAWQTRQAHFPAVLGMDDPRRTRALSLTGRACALDCAHCGGHYLETMLPLAGLEPADRRLAGATSLLISGGCDPAGRVPVTDHLERLATLRPGRRLNWHCGLVGEAELLAIRDMADVVSFDLVGNDETIAEVSGLAATVADYRRTYRLLRRHVVVIPHITIGLRGGQLSGERAALRILHEEGAAAIVFLVLIPTPGTRYAGRTPPPVEEVARLLAEARLAFPEIPLLLGCMRPGGSYRRALDCLAVRAGVNRIVKPARAGLTLASDLGLRLEATEECCALALPISRAGGRSADLSCRHAQVADRMGSPGLHPSAGETWRVSAGTEAVLGLRHRPLDAAPTTAYLMLDGGGCALGCAFCAQARGSRARPDALSRVIWPEYRSEAVLAALEQAPAGLQRVCFQVTVHRGALDEAAAAVQEVRRRSSLPISVAIRPPDARGVGRLLSCGADALGLGLDCASERIYRQVKGAGWQRMIALVEAACREHAGRVRVHLMVGLGETEEELCRAMAQVYGWGGAVSLFAFTPVRGTPLAGRPQPPLDVYRRMQVARCLLDRGLAQVEQFRFDAAGRLRDFQADLPVLLGDGEAFRTSGCPGCNRPFYNERPGGTVYNYPRAPNVAEIEQAIAQAAGFCGRAGAVPTGVSS